MNAALPVICAGIREQRASILAAIEAYKARFGVYPPDHVVSRNPLRVDPVKNPLLYELAGVIYNPKRKVYEVQGQESADAQYVRDFFHLQGFKNQSEDPTQIQRFLTLDPLPVHQLHDDPDVFALGFTDLYRENIAPEVVWELDISPWRYVSSSPTNNPAKFDLWIEVKAPSKSLVIGNWPTVE